MAAKTKAVLCAVALVGMLVLGACGSGNSAGSSKDEAGSLHLVAIGDSIPFNSPEDCPKCTGFVDRYADALAEATGHKVETQNLSQHNNLTLPMLLDELDGFKDQLSTADAIVIGIAHNSIALNQDEACGTTFDTTTNNFADWSKMTPKCAADSAAEYEASYDKLFSTVDEWREGKPTIQLTLNKYSDWIGWDALAPEHQTATVPFHDDWNKMLCASAESNGFTCVDLYHAFNGPDGTKPAGDLLAADYTHPSDKGNATIADLLASKGFAPLT